MCACLLSLSYFSAESLQKRHLRTASMSIAASDRGETDGVLARRYAATGEMPASSPSVLVMMQAQNSDASPFSSFQAPPNVLVAAEDATMLAAVNTICERYQALDGAQGCLDDRICGVFPPWVCCLPLICCLGGACAVVARTKGKVLSMTKEIKAVLSAHPAWMLCAASHASRVDMSRVRATQGPNYNAPSPTITQTFVWLEKRRNRGDVEVDGFHQSKD